MGDRLCANAEYLQTGACSHQQRNRYMIVMIISLILQLFVQYNASPSGLCSYNVIILSIKLDYYSFFRFTVLPKKNAIK